VTVRNVPKGHTLNVFPSRLQVVLDCYFPVNSDPFENVDFYVDYNEFASSITGRCVVHCDNLGASVIDYKLTPEVCDCVENE